MYLISLKSCCPIFVVTQRIASCVQFGKKHYLFASEIRNKAGNLFSYGLSTNIFPGFRSFIFTL